MRGVSRSDRSGTPARLARWIAVSIIPLAVVGNVGAYLLAVYLLENARTQGLDSTGAWQIVTVIGLGSFQAVWLVWLRSQPFGTLVASVVMWLAAVFVAGYEPVAVQPGLLFVVFAYATERSGWRRSVALTAAMLVSFGALTAAYALRAHDEAPTWTTPAVLIDWAIVALATIGGPAVAGAWYASLRDRSERISQLAQRLASGEAARTAEAVAAERRTLAQEIHDTSSAHLAAILALSAAAASADSGAETPHRRLIAQIRSEGEKLYQGFERMLNSMRQEDRTVTGTHQAGRPGQHHVTDVDALVDDHRAATGARVTLIHSPTLDEIDQRLGPMRAHIAYRVVQEALSNVRKHAPGATVSIWIEDDDDTLLLRIENDSAPWEADAAGAGDRTLSLGYGLEGMRDRLVAAAGSLRTGPRQNGGWSVNALLPHPPHQRAAAPSRRAARRAGPPDASAGSAPTDLYEGVTQ